MWPIQLWPSLSEESGRPETHPSLNLDSPLAFTVSALSANLCLTTTNGDAFLVE